MSQLTTSLAGLFPSLGAGAAPEPEEDEISKRAESLARRLFKERQDLFLRENINPEFDPEAETVIPRDVADRIRQMFRPETGEQQPQQLDPTTLEFFKKLGVEIPEGKPSDQEAIIKQLRGLFPPRGEAEGAAPLPDVSVRAGDFSLQRAPSAEDLEQLGGSVFGQEGKELVEERALTLLPIAKQIVNLRPGLTQDQRNRAIEDTLTQMLETEGLPAFELTGPSESALDNAIRGRDPKVNELARGVDPEQIDQFRTVIESQEGVDPSVIGGLSDIEVARAMIFQDINPQGVLEEGGEPTPGLAGRFTEDELNELGAVGRFVRSPGVLQRFTGSVVKGLLIEPAANFSSALGALADVAGAPGLAQEFFDASQNIRTEAERKALTGAATEGGFTELAGEVVGGIAPSALYLIASAELQPAILAFFAVRALGGGAEDYRTQLQDRGVEPDAIAQLLVGVGNGAAEVAFEKMGLDTIGRIGTKVAGNIGDLILRGKAGDAARVIAGVATTAGVEGTEESLTQVASNAIAQFYDPDRPLTEGVGEAFALGAFGGGLLAGPAVFSRAGRAALAGTLRTPQEGVEEPATPPETAEPTVQPEEAPVTTAPVEPEQREPVVQEPTPPTVSEEQPPVPEPDRAPDIQDDAEKQRVFDEIIGRFEQEQAEAIAEAPLVTTGFSQGVEDLIALGIERDRARQLVEENFGATGQDVFVTQQGQQVSQQQSGQPITIETFRGFGRPAEETSMTPGFTAVFGPGRFSTTGFKSAAEFGPQVEQLRVTLRNPRVITNDQQLRELFNAPDLKSLSVEESEAAQVTARQRLIDEGVDGVVINLPTAETDQGGVLNKALRSVFDTSQVIEFNPPAGTQQGQQSPDAFAISTVNRDTGVPITTRSAVEAIPAPETVAAQAEPAEGEPLAGVTPGIGEQQPEPEIQQAAGRPTGRLRNRVAPVGRAPRATDFASFAKSEAETATGKQLVQKIKNDKKGSKAKVGPRSIVDAIMRQIDVIMQVQTSQTTKRNPANFRPGPNIITDRSGIWQLRFHEIGHAISHLMVIRKGGKRFFGSINDDLVALTQMEGSFASRKTAEEGFAEFTRRYIAEFGTLADPIRVKIENYLKTNHPETMALLRDAHRAYSAHRARPALEQLSAINRDKPVTQGLRDRSIEHLTSFVHNIFGNTAVLHFMRVRIFDSITGGGGKVPVVGRPIRGLIDKSWRSQAKLARRFFQETAGTRADFETANNMVQHAPAESWRVLDGTKEGRQGIRVRARGDDFAHLSDDAIDDLTTLGIPLRQIVTENSGVKPGEWLWLSDFSWADIKATVGEKNWDAFQVYGQYRAALDRFERRGDEYPGFSDDFPPARVREFLTSQEQANPGFANAFGRVNEFFNRLLVIPMLTGEINTVDAARIVAAFNDYWPLPRQVENVPTRTTGGGEAPSAGLKRAFGSQLPFVDIEEATRIRVKMAIDSYYQTALIDSFRQLGKKMEQNEEFGPEAIAAAKRLMVPLRLDNKKAVTLSEDEQKVIIADAMNQLKADELGISVDQLDDQALNPDEIALSIPGRPIFRHRKPELVHVVQTFEDGSPVYSQVLDPNLFNLISMTKRPALLMTRLGEVFAQGIIPWKKVLTQNIVFAIGNGFARDPFTAVLNADPEFKRAIIPFYFHGLAMINRLKKGLGFKAVDTEAALQETALWSKAMEITTDRAHKDLVGVFLDPLKEDILIEGYADMDWTQKLAGHSRQINAALLKPAHMLNYMTGGPWISRYFETLTREGAAIEALRQGYTPAQAQLAYDEVTGNFGQRPATAGVDTLYRSAGFVNPGLQIMWTTIQRLTSPDPTQSAYLIGAKMPMLAILAGVGAALNWIYSDDEAKQWLRERREEDRLKFMGIGGIFRFPFDYGIAGGIMSFGWNSIEGWLSEEGIDSDKRALDFLERSLSIPGPHEFLNPWIKTAIELKVNYSLFFDKEIVPSWLEVQFPFNPELQSFDDTAKIYQEVARSLDVSPLKVQYAVRSLFTSQTDAVVQLLELASGNLSVDEKADLPIGGRLFLRDPIGFQSQSVRELRQLEAEFDGAKTTIIQLASKRDKLSSSEIEALESAQKKMRILAPAKAEMTRIRRMFDAWLVEKNKENPSKDQEKRLRSGMVKAARRFQSVLGPALERELKEAQ